jgi:2-oxoglutarate ferredoxin oxidoreductase subunit delta
VLHEILCSVYPYTTQEIKKNVKGMIIIDKELCKGCAYCVDTCPFGVIIIDERFNKKGVFPATNEHPDRCNGCAMCAHMCPEIAIEVFREE